MPARSGAVLACLLLGAAGALLPLARASAQAEKPARPLDLERIADDLYLMTGEGGNVAVYVTGDGVVLVDDMFHRNYADIVARIVAVTDQPIRYVLNTHQHDDHAGGNARMREIADVIAHDNVWINLSDIRQPYYEDTPGTPIGLPNVTFAEELVLRVGGKEIRARHFGRGHTNGDVVVYFPELRLIHTGDLFLGRSSVGDRTDRPRGVNIYVDYAQGGSFLDWTATLDAVLELDFVTIIPGHGPISTRADLVRFRADLEAMRDRIAALVRSGATRDQVLAVFEMDYGWRSTGCPPTPPTPGCLQYQQMDALIRELQNGY